MRLHETAKNVTALFRDTRRAMDSNPVSLAWLFMRPLLLPAASVAASAEVQVVRR